jgi:hypothetical protein
MTSDSKLLRLRLAAFDRAHAVSQFVVFKGKDLHQIVITSIDGRMARGGHGLPKVSPGSAMPYPSTPAGRATPKTALGPMAVSGVASPQGGRPAGVFYPFSHPTPTPMTSLPHKNLTKIIVKTNKRRSKHSPREIGSYSAPSLPLPKFPLSCPRLRAKSRLLSIIRYSRFMPFLEQINFELKGNFLRVERRWNELHGATVERRGFQQTRGEILAVPLRLQQFEASEEK